MSVFKFGRQARYTTTARILGKRKHFEVFITNEGPFPAWVHLDKKTLYLNDSFPAEPDHLRRIILDKGKLFHEIAHIRYTRGHDRERLRSQAPDPKFFHDLVNVLEDGRIEARLASDLPGTEPYLCYLSTRFIEMNLASVNPLNDLAMRVRFGTYKRPEFWKPVEHLIKKSLKASSTKKVAEIALKICNILANQEPSSESSEDGQKQGHDPAKPNGPEEERDEHEDQEQQPQQPKEPPQQSGDTTELPNPDAIRDDIAGSLKEELEAEFKVICELGETKKEKQLFKDGAEEDQAEGLAQVIHSLRADRSRARWVPSSKRGLIDSSRLCNLITRGNFLKTREMQPSMDVAVCIGIDTSGSMKGYLIGEALRAGRVLNGGWQKAGIEANVLLFNTLVKREPVSPMKYKTGGGTNISSLIEEATALLQDTPAKRRLVIVVTDGYPDRPPIDARRAANEAGVFVLTLQLQLRDKSVENWSDAALCIMNPSDLLPCLETAFVEFLAA